MGKGSDEVTSKRIILTIVPVIVIILAFTLFHSSRSRSLNNTATEEQLLIFQFFL